MRITLIDDDGSVAVDEEICYIVALSDMSDHRHCCDFRYGYASARDEAIMCIKMLMTVQDMMDSDPAVRDMVTVLGKDEMFEEARKIWKEDRK